MFWKAVQELNKNCEPDAVLWIGWREQVDMIRVRSSSINAVGYNPDTNHLYIKFNNNSKTYTFYNVPFQIYNELMAAASKGRYYHRNIEGRYRG